MAISYYDAPEQREQSLHALNETISGLLTLTLSIVADTPDKCHTRRWIYVAITYICGRVEDYRPMHLGFMIGIF